jgi:hypothetical protein
MTREHIVVAAAVGLLIVASPLYVRRVGDFAVFLVGADPKELRKWNVDGATT